MGTEEDHDDDLGQKDLVCKDRLSQLGLFNLKKRILQGDLIEAFQHLKERWGWNLCQVVQ